MFLGVGKCFWMFLDVFGCSNVGRVFECYWMLIIFRLLAYVFWPRPAGRRVLCNQLRPSVRLCVRDASSHTSRH